MPAKSMKCAIIAITRPGLTVARKIKENLDGDLYAPEKFITGGAPNVIGYDTSTKKLVEKIWGKYQSFIFIMSLGIVTRIIKDSIRDKRKDPAIVVVDELGRYCISALCGHEGKANKLAEKISLVCGGDFVITTGSEAVKTLIVGIGCCRGAAADCLEETLMEGLGRIGRGLKEVRLIASVEDKKNEAGLLQLSKKLDIPLKFIPKTLIKTVEDGFTRSELVKKTLGIYSVAEPCAMLGGFRCQLILPKTKIKKTTIAIAEERFL